MDFSFIRNITKDFFYLDHRTGDSKYNIITDVYVRLDAGYFTNPICKGVVDRKLCLLKAAIQNMKKIARVIAPLFLKI
ncbi:hypothetical protein P8V03_05955 [Clostridium sp. A1-XYC3]|uniref:Transposase DDE domain-containing protein n=1 Tax=Clostridium tanneri TaxID=3037988 RepID=A0ABU4JRC6_9CLOT|nr:hypothetical protein [Clostridium sp. A1-XYC3]MDW8800695.1 hypothetical protein [Clostridium sp. A1-XYC3]